MRKLYTHSLQCFNECGATIQVTIDRQDTGASACHSAAEALGWATIDLPKGKSVVVCPGCLERSRMIVQAIGMAAGRA